MNLKIKEQLKHIPEKAGVYLYKNEDGEVIYVGKAKNLKKRVSSYFTKNHPDVKTHQLVDNIRDIETIVVGSELEALLTECNLIKKYTPRYNIMLKDNKTYPFIKVTTNEPFPKVLKTRHIVRDGSRYFGPYISVGYLLETIEMLHRLFPIRYKNKKLPSTNPKEKPCLNYHIGRCKAPCIGGISQEDYDDNIKKAIMYLDGHYRLLINELEKQMYASSKNLDFEVAAKLRDNIKTIKERAAKQKVVLEGDIDLDIVGLYPTPEAIFLAILFVREGKLLGKRNFVIDNEIIMETVSKQLQTAPDKGVQLLDLLDQKLISEMLGEFLKTYYASEVFIPDEILLPYTIETEDDLKTLFEMHGRLSPVKILTPQTSTKGELVKMACDNAKFYYQSEEKVHEKDIILIELKNLLGLKKEPRRIEGFDIANVQGLYAVASMVSFLNGFPDKKNYRYFKIQSIDTPNDYQMMSEAVSRRYMRLQNENLTLPDLLLVDGGKGQVSSAYKILKALGLEKKIPLIGLAKRDEEIFFPNIPEPLILPKNSNALRLLQRVRDEAHRFCNTFHKKLRGKNALKSLLDFIDGIGPTRKKNLYEHFKSIENMKLASVEDINKVEKMNKKVSEVVYEFFH